MFGGYADPSDDDAMSGDDAAPDAAAAAAAAAGPSSQAAASPPAQQQKRRKVRQERTTADKVRRLHGKCKKQPASRFSLLHLAAPIQTTQEKQLFWELYLRYTKSGSTAWHSMAAVWNHRASIRMARRDFTVSLKAERHLKDYHRQTVKDMMQQANFAADDAITSMGAPPVGTRLGRTDTDLVLPPLPPSLPPTQVVEQLFPSSQAAGTATPQAIAAAAAAAASGLAARSSAVADDGASAVAATTSAAAGMGSVDPGPSRPAAGSPGGLAARVRTALKSLSPFKASKHPPTQQAQAPAVAVARSRSAQQQQGTLGSMQQAAGSAELQGAATLAAGRREQQHNATEGASVGSGAAAEGSMQATAAAVAAATAAAAAGEPVSAAAGSSRGTPGSSAAAAATGQATPPTGGGSAPTSCAAAQWSALLPRQGQQRVAASVKIAGAGGQQVGCVWFPEGYPVQRLDANNKPREITKCSKCSMPKWVPDEEHPGQLRENKAHQPTCPRATGEYTHQSGKKVGRVAANYKYKK